MVSHLTARSQRPKVSAIGLGAMGLGGAQFYGAADEGRVLEMLSRAAGKGITSTFWDTADVYGDSWVPHACDDSGTPDPAGIFLSTKFGAKDLRENAENICQRVMGDSDPDLYRHE
ncbi:hypothetical protein GGX14DRAFT_645896 [Mycena pura]|uniref:NADP-dependent oxidoreductase domain-containing protein n=1 Tax=Mycena pura TaxID=153505 RepID=A0AAD6VB55_9AGAR|nr:hypothetical protein GGX14DRAFT_645896 [Mycena pura]